MAEYHSKRPIIDYNNLVSLFGTSRLICVDEGVLQIIRKLILDRANWATTYVKTYEQDSYTPPSETEMEEVRERVAEFIGDTNDMALCDEIIAQLASIAASAASGGGCGCGSRGAPATDPPPGPEDFGSPGEGVGDPPEGFASWEEYEEYKCDVAEWIWQVVNDDISWWQTADFIAMTITAFVAALITPVPFDDIVVALALLLGLALQGVIADALSDMKNAWLNSHTDLICALYSAGSPAGSRQQIDDAISDAIDLISSDPYAPLEKHILRLLVSNHLINKMYQKDELLEPNLPTGDCSTCIPCQSTTVTVAKGTILAGAPNGNGDPFTVEAEWVTNRWRVQLSFPDDGCCATVEHSVSNYTKYNGSQWGGWYDPCDDCGTREEDVDWDVEPSPVTHCTGNYSLTQDSSTQHECVFTITSGEIP